MVKDSDVWICNKKKPSYRKQWLSWHVQILPPIQKIRKIPTPKQINQVSHVTCCESPLTCPISIMPKVTAAVPPPAIQVCLWPAFNGFPGFIPGNWCYFTEWANPISSNDAPARPHCVWWCCIKQHCSPSSIPPSITLDHPTFPREQDQNHT